MKNRPFPALALVVVSLLLVALCTDVQSGPAEPQIRIVELQGTAEISPAGATTWVLTQTNQVLRPFDRLRTGSNSRISLRWSDHSVVRFGALSEIEVLPPHTPQAQSGLHLLRGILSFFHRDKPGRVRVITRGAVAGIEGTEFVVDVDTEGDREITTLFVLDGKVSFSNELASLVLTNGQQAVAEPGQAPVLVAGFIANNVLQWALYYPAILDLRDLPLTPAEEQILSASLAAYRQGDLLRALAEYPAQRQPASEAERIYSAALLLSVGQLESTEKLLATQFSEDRTARLAVALRRMIAGVKRQPDVPPRPPVTATELLAASYYEQSRAVAEESLRTARSLAERAVKESPQFGFGWARLAELEFSFGRIDEAAEAIEKSLALTPRNAQALALKGFLFASRNRVGEGTKWFNQAIAIDSALANAWLGRGLLRIRKGDVRGGQEDLLMASALEPQRSLLRSYLGKGYAERPDKTRAAYELDLAKQLDPNDPTPWLYSAILKGHYHEINDAIRDLERSQQLNENRRVYRSQLLLDQDRAVRTANLARLYDDAGLGDVAVQEASRGVAADYGNYSAHLFLANSYELLRRSTPFDLRFETVAINEYLLANLMGPPEGRLLAQPITQQEYSELFERDRLGVSSRTEYLSRGAWAQSLAQHGTFRNSSYALIGDYRTDPGDSPHSALETRFFSAQFKHMITQKDGLFFRILDFWQESEDLAQRYDPTQRLPGLKSREKQEPSFLIGYDHQWNEEQRTLVLASRFNDSFFQANPRGSTFLLTEFFGEVDGFFAADLTQRYKSRITVNSFEVQHIARFQGARLEGLQTIAGIRFQHGTDRLFNEQVINVGNSPNLEIYFGNPGTLITKQSLTAHSYRISPYVYQHWEVMPRFWLIGGVSYDYQSQPRNVIFAPLDDDHKLQRYLSPKAAAIWTPVDRMAVRAAYTRSLGGIDLDQSIRLEPAQIAGFVQAYRTINPNSLVGGVGGTKFETADVSVEYRFPTETYATIAGQWLLSEANHDVGAFRRDLFTGTGPIEQVQQRLRYDERTLDLSLHQLVGDYVTLGCRYRLSDARLAVKYPQVPTAICFAGCGNSRGLIHVLSLNGLLRHPGGFFAGAQGTYWAQELRATLGGLPNDRFWQMDLLAGYRFPRRQVEITIGLLNATAQDYRLHPINLHPELPRDRTLLARLEFNF